MSRKKILYIHHGIGIGGAPLSLLYLIENLDRKKYHPVVLFLQDSEVIDLYRSKNIDVVGPLDISDFSHTKIWWYRWYHLHHFGKALWSTYRTIHYVADYWFERIKPDIVHLNTSTLIAWGKVACRRKIPVVWHVREPLASGYLGLRRKIVQKFVEKYATTIMPICKNDAKPWKKSSKVQVIYNAVDSNKFDAGIVPYCVKGSESDPKILFLGGLSREKGTLVIFKIFKKLLHIVPNVKLIVAGYFDDSTANFLSPDYYFPTERYKRKIKKALKEIKDSTIFIGPSRDVPRIMVASNVVVFPATVGHFARPIIEAGFMKKPVVASKLSPLDELVIDGKTGFLVDFNDLDLWARKLFLLLSDKNLSGKIGNNAFEYCKKNFDVKDQVKRIQNVYEVI